MQWNTFLSIQTSKLLVKNSVSVSYEIFCKPYNWSKAHDLILAKGPRPNLGLTCIRSNVYLGPTLVYQKGAKWSADFILGTCICKGGEGVTSDAWFPSFAPPPLCFQNYNIMTSQPVTFNNLNHKRVSSILCWVLSLFIAIFHIARGRTFTAFSKNPPNDGMTSVWYFEQRHRTIRISMQIKEWPILQFLKSQSQLALSVLADRKSWLLGNFARADKRDTRRHVYQMILGIRCLDLMIQRHVKKFQRQSAEAGHSRLSNQSRWY